MQSFVGLCIILFFRWMKLWRYNLLLFLLRQLGLGFFKVFFTIIYEVTLISVLGRTSFRSIRRACFFWFFLLWVFLLFIIFVMPSESPCLWIIFKVVSTLISKLSISFGIRSSLLEVWRLFRSCFKFMVFLSNHLLIASLLALLVGFKLWVKLIQSFSWLKVSTANWLNVHFDTTSSWRWVWRLLGIV